MNIIAIFLNRVSIFNNTMERTARFLRFENEKETEVVISDWTSEKFGDVLFKAYVTEVDGQEVDKIWTAFDFDLAQQLKKSVRGKKTHNKLRLKVTMREIDEFDKEYTVKVVS